MNKSAVQPDALALYPEDIKASAEIVKQALLLMVRHKMAPNPVHFSLGYHYCRGQDAKLQDLIDLEMKQSDGLSAEIAVRLFRDFVISQELEIARTGQQQVIELVDDIECNISRSVAGSQAYQTSLNQGLAALQQPLADDLPNVLNELQQSTQLMQDQQEQFLYRLQAAQGEIANLRLQLNQAHIAATLDSLTQVFNRNAFSRLLEQALQVEKPVFALLMLDIDHFKQFNDQYGHPLGDRVLQHVGKLLRELLPEKATAARYGGEEFCVILQGCSDLAVVCELAELLRLKIQGLRVRVRSTDKVLDSITASFGVALAQPGDTAEDLITRADDALYLAKRSGRNQIQSASNGPTLSA